MKTVIITIVGIVLIIILVLFGRGDDKPIVAKIQTANGAWLVSQYKVVGSCVLFKDGAGAPQKFCSGYKIVKMPLPTSTNNETH